VEGILIRRVTARDADSIKSIRLRSLQSDPSSFGSTFVKEAAYAEQEWADWASGDASGDEMATVLALDDGEPVGIVGAYRDDDDDSLYHVIAMWVAPEYRGRGLGRALLRTIEAWVHECGGATIQLDVADQAAAAAAASLYQSAGYVLDGQRSPSPHTPAIIHLSMRKSLT
jgi:ribosomal protein S18 acetylase RimI-like enzyme